MFDLIKAFVFGTLSSKHIINYFEQMPYWVLRLACKRWAIAIHGLSHRDALRLLGAEEPHDAFPSNVTLSMLLHMSIFFI